MTSADMDPSVTLKAKFRQFTESLTPEELTLLGSLLEHGSGDDAEVRGFEMDLYTYFMSLQQQQDLSFQALSQQSQMMQDAVTNQIKNL